MSKLNNFTAATNTQLGAKRIALFLAALAALVLYAPVREYLLWTYRSPYYTHVVLIPVISAWLIFRQRGRIFSDTSYAFVPGCALAGLGILLLIGAATVTADWRLNDKHVLVACSVVFLGIGVFISLFGNRAFKAARFPLLFLVFMIPLPFVLEQWIISVLQKGSAEFVGILFPLTGVPVLRDSTVFHLPGLSIEVAPQCSGIRSSLALLITAVLAGHLFLQSTSRKVLLALAVIPVTMFKNGIRIVTLSLLGIYVDRGYLESSLHRDGGIVFFMLALLIMAPLLVLLRNGEGKR